MNPLMYESKEELQVEVERRLEKMWMTNNAKRGGQLPLNSALMEILNSHKYHYCYSHHVSRLAIKFIMGDMPFRGGGCKMCHQPYDSLEHFSLECTNNYLGLDESEIYRVFNNGSEEQIFDLLKSLKSIIIPA
eukprot:NODE_467_length_7071_cov_0.830752.p6 type:complete len:133 gc:universal NODE_467_length_7071_cov_0.830752:5908-6306(+)